MPSKIQWVINPDGTQGETINPVVGCSKISSGCTGCYAENMARRLAAMGLDQYRNVIDGQATKEGYKYTGWSGYTAFVPSELEKPYKWKKPRTIFVSSMGDLFHESVLFEWIYDVINCIANNQRHFFILLTKRPKIMQHYLNCIVGHPLSNLAIGVSVEDQATADERIPVLLQIPAAKRFISYEPAIGPVDLTQIKRKGEDWTYIDNCLDGFRATKAGGSYGNKLDGVILGGESGPKARPMNPDWVRSVRDQCQSAGVKFMFKQDSSHKDAFTKNNGNRGFPILSDGFPVLDGRIHRSLSWGGNK